jgi:hypothetical protein
MATPNSFFDWVDRVTADMRVQVEKYRHDVETLERGAAEPPAKKECAVTFCGREDCAEAALVPVCSSGHVMHWRCVQDFVKTAIKNNSDDYNEVEIQIACPLCRDDFLGKLVYLLRCIATGDSDDEDEGEQASEDPAPQLTRDDDEDEDFRAFSLSLALLGTDPDMDEDSSSSSSSSSDSTESSEGEEEEEEAASRKRPPPPPPPETTEERRPIVRRRVTATTESESVAGPPPNFTYSVDTEAPAENFDMHIRSEARQGTGSRVLRHFAHRPRRRRPGILPRVHASNNTQPGNNH